MKYNTKNLEGRMDKAIASYESNLADVRASQANAAVLNRVTFDYYGCATPIKDMAAISLSDARTLVITPFDKSTLKAMEKAIQMSDVGINPQNDGTVLRLVFPQLTEERRKALAKQVKGMGEEAKVALRNIRRDAMDETKKAKKDGTMTEDEVKDAEKAIQDVTDKYSKKVDALTAAKEKELMAL